MCHVQNQTVQVDARGVSKHFIANVEVAQRSETERYQHKSRVPVSAIGKSLFILKDSNFGLDV